MPNWKFSASAAVAKITQRTQSANSFSVISPLKFFKPKIFISIAAYRDPEIIPTIKDAIAKASCPENLTFGVVWQALPEDEEITKQLKELPCKIIEINANQSLGACWARSLGQKLLYDEDFILQLDSHHRFNFDWDSILLDLLFQCPSSKPLLSGYTAPYIPPNEIPPGYVANRLAANFFNEHGILGLIAADSLYEYTEPQLGMFIAGGFIFASRQFYLEVPYDPYLYFNGEEVSLSVRAWTHGWDIFHPHKIVFYHYYTRSESKKHWETDSEWYRLETQSRERIRQLFRLDLSHSHNLEIYDLGQKRSLEEYEIFSGVNFRQQEISATAKKGLPQTNNMAFQKL